MRTMGMKTTASAWLMTTLADRLDWSEIRDRIDLGRRDHPTWPCPRPPWRERPPLVEVPVPRRQEPVVLCQPDQADLEVLWLQ